MLSDDDLEALEMLEVKTGIPLLSRAVSEIKMLRLELLNEQIAHEETRKKYHKVADSLGRAFTRIADLQGDMALMNARAKYESQSKA